MKVDNQDVDKIVQIILDNVKNLIKKFKEENNKNIPEDLSNDKLLIINNSFIFRKPQKTKKNNLYICVDKIKDISEENIKIATFLENKKINKDYRIIKSEDVNCKDSLRKAIKEELKKIGTLTFLLTGYVKKEQKFTVMLKNKTEKIENIVLNFQLEKNFIKNKTIYLKEPVSFDTIKKMFEEEKDFNNDNDKLIRSVYSSYNSLLNNNFLEVQIDDNSNEKSNIMEQILDELKNNIESYTKSLEEDNKTEILRIAYNFTSDYFSLIKFMISLCDLKPLLFWMTMEKYFDLNYEFKKINWDRYGKKASLDEYSRIIGQMRNNLFHRMFPLRMPLKVRLKDGAIKGVTITLFKKYNNKSESIDFQDKKIIEMLEGFHSNSPELVSYKELSDNNKEIMEKTYNLLSESNKNLKYLKDIVFKTKER